MVSFNFRRCTLLLVASVAFATANSNGPTTTFVPKNSIIDYPGGNNAKTFLSDFVDQPQPSSITKTNFITSAARGGALTINGNEVKGAIIFTLLDYMFRKAFVKYGINFPSQLGGCCILFVAMLLAEAIKPGLGDSVFTTLTPGANILAKWLPVFFVPGLAMLPLAPSMGSPLEVSKSLLL